MCDNEIVLLHAFPSSAILYRFCRISLKGFFFLSFFGLSFAVANQALCSFCFIPCHLESDNNNSGIGMCFLLSGWFWWIVMRRFDFAGVECSIRMFWAVNWTNMQGKLERKVTSTVFGGQSFAGFFFCCCLWVCWLSVWGFFKLEKSFEIMHCYTVCRWLNYVLYTWLTIYGAMSYLIGECICLVWQESRWKLWMEEIVHPLNDTHYMLCYQKIIWLFPAKSCSFQWSLSHLKTSIKHKNVINSDFHLGCARQGQGKIEKPQLIVLSLLGILDFLKKGHCQWQGTWF